MEQCDSCEIRNNIRYRLSRQFIMFTSENECVPIKQSCTNPCTHEGIQFTAETVVDSTVFSGLVQDY